MAARVAPVSGAALALALAGCVVAIRALVARLQPQHEWDEPSASVLALGGLAAGAFVIAWLASRGVAQFGAAWALTGAAAALGAVAAYAAALSLAALDRPDPFANDPRRLMLALAFVLLAGTAALAYWSPRLVPLLALALVGLAAAGRPRTLGVLSLVLAVATLAIADRAPVSLSRMAGGWPAAAALALAATMLALGRSAACWRTSATRVRARLRAATGHLLTLAEKSPGLVATFDRETPPPPGQRRLPSLGRPAARTRRGRAAR